MFMFRRLWFEPKTHRFIKRFYIHKSFLLFEHVCSFMQKFLVSKITFSYGDKLSYEKTPKLFIGKFGGILYIFGNFQKESKTINGPETQVLRVYPMADMWFSSVPQRCIIVLKKYCYTTRGSWIYSLWTMSWPLFKSFYWCRSTSDRLCNPHLDLWWNTTFEGPSLSTIKFSMHLVALNCSLTLLTRTRLL